MRHLDFLLYALVLGVVVWALFGLGEKQGDAPEPLPDHFVQDGPMLPNPSMFDEQVLVMVEEPQNGLGTAFAVDRQGNWLTARHVVDGCRSVSLLVAPGRYVPVERVQVSPSTDLALLSTGRSPRAVSLDLESPLRIGEPGYHVGYPAGRPGEVATRLLARSNLLSRGLRRTEEPVIAWAEVGRTRGLTGALSGLSGGPVFDANGRVRGVVVAESPRRGRIYTAAPSSVADFLTESGIAAAADSSARPIKLEDYGAVADTARNSLQVVKVACEVS
ncbi:MAG: serine protease [Hyphomonadaceae bacterium]|nr:serine protease [Hyphomonadaceae bacterium]